MGRMLSIFTAAALSTFAMTHLYAQDRVDETRKVVMANMTSETIECAAYFLIGSQGFRNANQENQAKHMERIADRAIEWAGMLSKEAGMMSEAIPASLNLAVRHQLKRIENNLANISILMEAYGELCVTVIDSPAERVAFWTEKVVNDLKAHRK